MTILRPYGRADMRYKTALLSLVMIGTGSVLVPATAEARPPVGQACPPRDSITVSSPVPNRWIGSRTRKVTGPGPITLSISVSREDSISTGISGGGGVSVSALVFAAESSFGVDLATTVMAGTTYQASYNVPAGRSGWLQWGNWGFGYSFKNGY